MFVKYLGIIAPIIHILFKSKRKTYVEGKEDYIRLYLPKRKSPDSYIKDFIVNDIKKGSF
jgi:hypothetical protein